MKTVFKSCVFYTIEMRGTKPIFNPRPAWTAITASPPVTAIGKRRHSNHKAVKTRRTGRVALMTKTVGIRPGHFTKTKVVCIAIAVIIQPVADLWRAVDIVRVADYASSGWLTLKNAASPAFSNADFAGLAKISSKSCSPVFVNFRVAVVVNFIAEFGADPIVGVANNRGFIFRTNPYPASLAARSGSYDALCPE